MKYLPLLLLSLFLLVVPQAQSANHNPSDSIFYPKNSTDSIVVKREKKHAPAKVIAISGIILIVAGSLLGSSQFAIFGAIAIIMSIIIAKIRSKNMPPKTLKSVHDASPKKGIVPIWRALLITLVGIGVGLLLFWGLMYLALSRGI